MILDRIAHPIVLAPLAGGPSTPQLAAAVSDAGGLGFLAGGYRTAAGTAEAIAAVRALTAAPFGVNLFVPSAAPVDEAALQAYLERLGGEAQRYGVAIGEPRSDDDDWQAKLDLLLAEPVAVVSFTFGCPPAATIAALVAAGSEVWVTVTDVAEARAARDAGAGALVVQGTDAGGHRGSFVDPSPTEGMGVLALLRLVAAAVELPLVATGGIVDGAGIAAALAGGATAAQLGTAFLLAPEAGTHAAHRAALAADTPTALTRAFSGRLARGLVNRFLTDHSADAPAAYPHVHHATSPLRAAARERGDGGGFNLWAGQTHALATERPAAEIVQTLAHDARAALARAAARLGDTP